ncbi:MAG: AI-2E family transporter [Bacteroidota bacterium]
MKKQYPFYIKATVILFGLTLLTYALSGLRDILTPICFSIMLAILLNRLVIQLEKWKLPKFWAIFISILLAFTLIACLAYFISSQIMSFGDDLPVLKAKFTELFSRFQHILQIDMGMPMKQQDQWLAEAETSMKPLIGQTIGTVAGTLGITFLLPVYTFLLLYYKPLFLHFLYEIFAETDSEKVAEVLKETKRAVQRYMIGLILEGTVVALLNTTALFLFGIKYAILLGVIGALLNLLPYIGGVIAILLPVMVATITKDGIQTQLGITAAYLLIQFIDNHVLIPLLVSSRVQINAFVSIVIVLLGGALWGISGMFLSIPFIGVLKIIFDRIDELKPWGKLLGTEEVTVQKLTIGRRKRKTI